MGQGPIEAINSYQNHTFAFLPPRLTSVLFALQAPARFETDIDTKAYQELPWKERLSQTITVSAKSSANWDLSNIAQSGLQRLDGKAIEASKSHPLQENDCRGALLSFEKDATKRIALEAGLWLWIDELDRSHNASQSREGDKTCDAWHTIMHRREADFWNAKYWVRRVGQHPSHDRLWTSLQALDRRSLTTSQQRIYDRIVSQKFWRGETMVDLCEEFARDQDGEEGALLRAIQQLEMIHLLAS